VPSTTRPAVALRTAAALGACDRLPFPCSMLSLHWRVEVQGNVPVGKFPVAVKQLRDECARQPPLVFAPRIVLPVWAPHAGWTHPSAPRVAGRVSRSLRTGSRRRSRRASVLDLRLGCVTECLLGRIDLEWLLGAGDLLGRSHDASHLPSGWFMLLELPRYSHVEGSRPSCRCRKLESMGQESAFWSGYISAPKQARWDAVASAAHETQDARPRDHVLPVLGSAPGP
jgi:hypothetical protein